MLQENMDQPPLTGESYSEGMTSTIVQLKQMSHQMARQGSSATQKRYVFMGMYKGCGFSAFGLNSALSIIFLVINLIEIYRNGLYFHPFHPKMSPCNHILELCVSPSDCIECSYDYLGKNIAALECIVTCVIISCYVKMCMKYDFTTPGLLHVFLTPKNSK